MIKSKHIHGEGEVMNCERKEVVKLLKTARGQIDGILKMLEDDRYCIDISNQIMAVESVVKKSNTVLLKNHMETCVKDAIASGNVDDKIDEIKKVITKIMK